MRWGVVAIAAIAALTTRHEDAKAQQWREAAAHVGTTARVLLVGTRPEDEDNALIAWLSLGRHVETAYLSVTRGEAGVNLIGSERDAPLAVVRTAELLAERQRDGAHQYFTRAYDFGGVAADSIVNRWWPHDSLLQDVVSIVRAFRPHVIISLADATDRDATRRLTARLAAEAFSVALDTARLPSRMTARLPPWTPARLFTIADSTVSRDRSIDIDVGAFNRSEGRSYAEIGAEIRQRQRTQGSVAAPPLGHLHRWLRLDSTRAGNGITLFGSLDTTLARFLPGSGEAAAAFDWLILSPLAAVEASLPNGTPDVIATRLARLAAATSDLRLALPCGDIDGVSACPGKFGDLAVALNTMRDRALRAMLAAAGIVIDATVGRELVATGDTVAASVTVYNGGTQPIAIRRLAFSTAQTMSFLIRDSSVSVPADSAVNWSKMLRVLEPSYHWWQMNGLVGGTLIHNFVGPRARAALIGGEDRVSTSQVEATLGIGGVEVPVVLGPLIYRAATALRGDVRHPLAGVPETSILLERNAEYERAGLPIDRLFRVYLWSARSTADTLLVTLRLPAGLRADSTTRTVVLPPFTARSVFFRLRGRLQPGSDTITATARSIPSDGPMSGMVRVDSREEFRLGVVSHEYPHIPAQQFVRFSNERLEAVDLRVPARLHVAYVKGTDEVPAALGQLQINLQTLEPSLLPVLDLRGYSTILIGANAFANDALVGAVPALTSFMRNGGTVVILPNGRDVGRSGLLPYPVALDSLRARVTDAAAVKLLDPASPLLRWPHVISAGDFEHWLGDRARGVPLVFDPRYRAVLSLTDPDQPPATGPLLAAPVGKGMIIVTSLAIDEQLSVANPVAARLMINLLSAGLRRE